MATAPGCERQLPLVPVMPSPSVDLGGEPANNLSLIVGPLPSESISCPWLTCLREGMSEVAKRRPCESASISVRWWHSSGIFVAFCEPPCCNGEVFAVELHSHGESAGVDAVIGDDSLNDRILIPLPSDARRKEGFFTFQESPGEEHGALMRNPSVGFSYSFEGAARATVERSVNLDLVFRAQG